MIWVVLGLGLVVGGAVGILLGPFLWFPLRKRAIAKAVQAEGVRVRDHHLYVDTNGTLVTKEVGPSLEDVYDQDPPIKTEIDLDTAHLGAALTLQLRRYAMFQLAQPDVREGMAKEVEMSASQFEEGQRHKVASIVGMINKKMPPEYERLRDTDLDEMIEAYGGRWSGPQWEPLEE